MGSEPEDIDMRELTLSPNSSVICRQIRDVIREGKAVRMEDCENTLGVPHFDSRGWTLADNMREIFLGAFSVVFCLERTADIEEIREIMTSISEKLAKNDIKLCYKNINEMRKIYKYLGHSLSDSLCSIYLFFVGRNEGLTPDRFLEIISKRSNHFTSDKRQIWTRVMKKEGEGNEVETRGKPIYEKKWEETEHFRVQT